MRLRVRRDMGLDVIVFDAMTNQFKLVAFDYLSGVTTNTINLVDVINRLTVSNNLADQRKGCLILTADHRHRE